MSPTMMCVSVCLPDPVSSSLAQSVMSMASSHSQHSHISTDTMSSMSGSYLAGAEGEPVGEEGGGNAEGEENQDAPMESRGPSQQDEVRMEGGGFCCIILTFNINVSSHHWSVSLCFIQEFSKEPKEQNYSVAVDEQDSEVTIVLNTERLMLILCV